MSVLPPKAIESRNTRTRSSKEPDIELQNSDREGNVIRGDVEKPVKSMSNLTLVSAAWNILNTWWGFGAAFALGITHGGPVTLIYGMMLLSLVYGATALSLAELSAHYPTAGGQYHWTFLLAPERLKRLLSYCCAIANAVGRVGICAGVTVANAQFILGLIAFNSPGYVIQRWHIFVLYQGINVVTFLYNAFALRHLPGTHQVGCILSIVSFFVIVVTCLAMANPKRSSSYVWTTFVDESGWQSSVATFLTGLTSPNFGLGGLDGPIHLSEDTFDPARTVPLSILVSLVMGCVSALLFVVAMLYCIIDLPSLISSGTGVPLFEMWFQATRSPAVTNTFIVLFTAVGLLTVIGSVATASRLTWAFARDDGLLGSTFIKKISSKQKIPVNALAYNAIWIAALGCLYLASSTAFNSLCGTGVLVEQASFAFPAALLMWRQRESRYLPRWGHFNMGRLGWAFNGVTVAWTIFVAIIYNLPPDMPATAGNMNYTCVVLVVVALLGALNWRLHARRNYNGPQFALLAGLHHETEYPTMKTVRDH